ncbi:hypothetical protein SADUNF_Sadunf19G0100600 [Salix dunnii]|uniref:CASTOR/POLLUX/SYM8 ion channel conserved domain-containing protein n=1 Tax=Salix dunnii TaxID=1413687 RepID=A0A835MI41_9ROSI|nr:hypothetical protein SADUNF_Sadunf19G0100600 [Salix dunnii]
MCVGCMQSDARALRTVLSLTGVKEGLKGHIVVELSDLDNEVLVKLVGGDLVQTVVAHDVIGRLMIQCARQPGLAQLWEDILGFENCEFYIKRWPQLHGMKFEDILISFPDAIPCGIKVASCGGKIILNPEDSYVLQEDDEIHVIAEDNDSYAPAALPTVLDAFLAPGSELWMFTDVPENEREKKLIDGGLDFSKKQPKKMAVKIRLARLGCKNRAFYRIVGADSHTPKHEKHLQVVGFYDPLADYFVIKDLNFVGVMHLQNAKGDARRLGLNADLVLVTCWYQPTDTARGILLRASLISPPPMTVMGQKKGPPGETLNPEKSITL